MRRRARHIPGGLLALALLGPLPAQEPPPDRGPLDSGLVERTERRLVQLDVSFVPRGKGVGDSIPELGPEDFELVINARPIRVEFADRVCNVNREESLVALEPDAPDVAPPAAVPARRATFIFYLEHTLLTMRGQNVAMEMAERLIANLVVDGNRGMVVSSGTKVVHSELTEDPRVLIRAIRDAATNVEQWGEYAYAENEASRLENIKNQPNTATQQIAARAFQMEEMRTTSKRLRRLAATLGGLAEVDAPKAVFYFADIARNRPGEHYAKMFGSQISPLNHTFAFEDVLASANSQGVRLYTVQAQGLHPPIPFSGGTDLGLGRIQAAEDTMISFGAETGGEMFFGGTDASTLRKIYRRIEQDLECFYLLSFHPDGLPEDSPLRVVLRLDVNSPAAAAAGRDFTLRTRGQLVVQSPRKREQSLLLAAHIASSTVESDPGRGVAIPLAFDGRSFQTLVQFVVRGADLPPGIVDDSLWDLGMTRVSGAEVHGTVSGRVGVSNPAAPVVLETEWSFAPGPTEIIFVGREQRLGQLATAHLELDWPDPNRARAIVTPIVVVQQVAGAFLRTGGGTEEVRSRGTLGVGDGLVQTAHPAFLVGLVCRGPRFKKDLWIQRRLVGATAAEFELLEWPHDGERCVQIRDLVREGQMGWGDFSYEVRVFDTPDLAGEPVAERTREFTALEQEQLAGMPLSR